MESLNLKIKAEPLVIETVEHLASTLDPTLYYHSPDHTKDVLRQTMELAEADALNSRDVLFEGRQSGYEMRRPNAALERGLELNSTESFR